MKSDLTVSRVLRLILGLLSLNLLSCNSSEIEDAIESFEDVPRKTINTDELGTNAFANDRRFGSIEQQFSEVKSTLRLNSVRLLFNWDNNVQPSPGAGINFSFYDDIVEALPAGMDAIVVLTGVPGWMSDSSNWINGNPRTTFVELWVKKVAARYAGRSRIIGWQIWNEPNMFANQDNVLLDLAANPANYVQMLQQAFSAIRAISPSKLVISAATTAINQNYPETLNYNRAMRDAAVTSFCDIYAIHYYGRQYENLRRSGGVADYLNGVDKEIWVTESGEMGINNQLTYAEQTWPLLRDEVGGIRRIYQYQFTEAGDANSTYGLRNLTPGLELSDLYIYLRDR